MAADLYGNVCDVCPFVRDFGQSDRDGDGSGDACDCEPDDPVARAAADVTGIVAEQPPSAGVARFAWPPASGADSFAITRATLSEVRGGIFGQCVVPSQAGAVFEDAEMPSAGEGFAYLIRGISPACGMGTLGAGRNGSERINPDPQACW